MNKFTFATIAGGLGGGSLGAKQAGGTPLWNLDYDPSYPTASYKIGKAYSQNLNSPHLHLSVEKAVELIKQKKLFLPVPDVLIITWSCKNFSVANQNNKETEGDIKAAKSIAFLIRLFNSPYVIFENVTQWMNSQSWQKILRTTLISLGYYVEGDDHPLDAADFAVPQHRKRLIIRCAKYPIPPLQPSETHVGCLEAIADLIPTLELTQLTAKQKEAYKNPQNCVIERVGWRGSPNSRRGEYPMMTLRASSGDDGKGGGRSQIYTICKDGQFRNASLEVFLRWQGFPDETILPDDSRYAVRGIGNAVPPPMIKAAIESMSPEPQPYSFIQYHRDPSPQIELVKAIWDYYDQPRLFGIYLRNGIVPLALKPKEAIFIEPDKYWYSVWNYVKTHNRFDEEKFWTADFKGLKKTVENSGDRLDPHLIYDLIQRSSLNHYNLDDGDDFCVQENRISKPYYHTNLAEFNKIVADWDIINDSWFDQRTLTKVNDLIYVELPHKLPDYQRLLFVELNLFNNPIIVNCCANSDFMSPYDYEQLGYYYDDYYQIAFKNIGKDEDDSIFIKLLLDKGFSIMESLKGL